MNSTPGQQRKAAEQANKVFLAPPTSIDVFNSTAKFFDNGNKFNFDISCISTINGASEFNNDFVTTTRTAAKSNSDAPMSYEVSFGFNS